MSFMSNLNIENRGFFTKLSSYFYQYPVISDKLYKLSKSTIEIEQEQRNQLYCEIFSILLNDTFDQLLPIYSHIIAITKGVQCQEFYNLFTVLITKNIYEASKFSGIAFESEKDKEIENTFSKSIFFKSLNDAGASIKCIDNTKNIKLERIYILEDDLTILDHWTQFQGQEPYSQISNFPPFYILDEEFMKCPSMNSIKVTHSNIRVEPFSEWNDIMTKVESLKIENVELNCEKYIFETDGDAFISKTNGEFDSSQISLTTNKQRYSAKSQREFFSKPIDIGGYITVPTDLFKPPLQLINEIGNDSINSSLNYSIYRNQ